MGIQLEVIKFFDETGTALVQRIPSEGSTDIKIGAQLIVQENQEAIFVRNGEICDTFGPGRHTLCTENVPIITRALTLPWSESPFQAQVYFVAKQAFVDLKWGTKQPIAYRDQEFSMIRLRSFGKYSLRVKDVRLLLSQLVGTKGRYTTSQIEDFLKDVIVARLTDLLGDNLDTILDLPTKYDQLAEMLKGRVFEDFDKYGLALEDFFIAGITPPDDVQQMMDARSGMHAVGDIDRFMKFKAAQAMGDAARAGGDGGSAAGTGLGMGVGVGLGAMIPGMMQSTAMQPTQSTTMSATQHCQKCNGTIADDAMFCRHCGSNQDAQQESKAPSCTECGHTFKASANFCPKCGTASK